MTIEVRPTLNRRHDSFVREGGTDLLRELTDCLIAVVRPDHVPLACLPINGGQEIDAVFPTERDRVSEHLRLPRLPGPASASARSTVNCMLLLGDSIAVPIDTVASLCFNESA